MIADRTYLNSEAHTGTCMQSPIFWFRRKGLRQSWMWGIDSSKSVSHRCRQVWQGEPTNYFPATFMYPCSLYFLACPTLFWAVFEAISQKCVVIFWQPYCGQNGKLMSVSHHILRRSPAEAATEKQWLQYDNIRPGRWNIFNEFISKAGLRSFDTTLLCGRFIKQSLLIPGSAIILKSIILSTLLCYCITYKYLIEVWLLRNDILFTDR